MFNYKNLIKSQEVEEIFILFGSILNLEIIILIEIFWIRTYVLNEFISTIYVQSKCTQAETRKQTQKLKMEIKLSIKFNKPNIIYLS